MKRVVLSKEDCFCGIEQLYQNVALKSGLDPSDLEDATFNCTRICVTKPVQNEVFHYDKEKWGASDFTIGADWVRFGPKANLPGDDFAAEIEEDFVSVDIPLF